MVTAEVQGRANQGTSPFQASAAIPSTNIAMTKASHMAELSVKVQGINTQAILPMVEGKCT